MLTSPQTALGLLGAVVGPPFQKATLGGVQSSGWGVERSLKPLSDRDGLRDREGGTLTNLSAHLRLEDAF